MTKFNPKPGLFMALAGATCLTLIAVGALAQASPPAGQDAAGMPPPEMPMDMPMGMHAMHRDFADLDSNKDGKIDRAEFNRPPPDPFYRMDTDHDGAISKAEFDAFKPRMMMFRGDGLPPGDMPGGPDGGPHMEKRIIMRMGPPDLKVLDANNDGKVSLDEFSAPMKDHFARLDTNHDGVLSDDELKADGPPPHP